MMREIEMVGQTNLILSKITISMAESSGSLPVNSSSMLNLLFLKSSSLLVKREIHC
jgi:hypothetical protein